MDPAMQQMLMSMMSQFMGGGQGGQGGQAGPYTGHNDMLLGSFGAPTSVSPPGFYNAGKLEFLKNVRDNFITSGGDENLERIGDTLGIDPSTSAMMLQLFPQLQKFVSTRSDMTGGAFAMAAMQNPYLATAVPGESEIAEEDFRVFEEDLYRRVRRRTDTEMSIADGRFTGIRDESDAGAVLMHATQTRQAMLPRRRTDETGRIVDLDPDELAQEAEKVLERFDGVIEAGRKIFGPNESAQKILNKMRRVGGDIRSTAQGEELVNQLNKTIGMATYTGANVGAVLNSQVQLQEKLDQAGIIGSVGREVARESTLGAMTNKYTADLRKDFFTEQGYSTINHSFDTYQQAQAQNTLRVLHSDDQMRELAMDFAQENGMSTSPESLNAIVAGYGENLTHAVRRDTLSENVRESAMQVAKLGAEQIKREFKPAFIDADQEAVDTIFERRFVDEDTAESTMFKIERAMESGDWSELEEIAGTGEFNASTKTFLSQMELRVGQEVFGDVGELVGASEEELLEMAEHQQTGKAKPKIFDEFLDRAHRRRREKIFEDVKKFEKEGKIELESISGEAIDASEQDYENWTDEELAEVGVFRRVTPKALVGDENFSDKERKEFSSMVEDLEAEEKVAVRKMLPSKVDKVDYDRWSDVQLAEEGMFRKPTTVDGQTKNEYYEVSSLEDEVTLTDVFKDSDTFRRFTLKALSADGTFSGDERKELSSMIEDLEAEEKVAVRKMLPSKVDYDLWSDVQLAEKGIIREPTTVDGQTKNEYYKVTDMDLEDEVTLTDVFKDSDTFRTRSERVQANLDRLASAEKISIEAVEKDKEAYSRLTEEELADRNIFRKISGTGDDLKEEYFKIKDLDRKDDVSVGDALTVDLDDSDFEVEYFRATDKNTSDNISVKDALTGRAGEGTIESNINLFLDMLIEKVPMLAGKFLDEAETRET